MNIRLTRPFRNSSPKCLFSIFSSSFFPCGKWAVVGGKREEKKKEATTKMHSKLSCAKKQSPFAARTPNTEGRKTFFTASFSHKSSYREYRVSLRVQYSKLLPGTEKSNSSTYARGYMNNTESHNYHTLPEKKEGKIAHLLPPANSVIFTPPTFFERKRGERAVGRVPPLLLLLPVM